MKKKAPYTFGYVHPGPKVKTTPKMKRFLKQLQKHDCVIFIGGSALVTWDKDEIKTMKRFPCLRKKKTKA